MYRGRRCVGSVLPGNFRKALCPGIVIPHAMFVRFLNTKSFEANTRPWAAHGHCKTTGPFRQPLAPVTRITMITVLRGNVGDPCSWKLDSKPEILLPQAVSSLARCILPLRPMLCTMLSMGSCPDYRSPFVQREGQQ